MRTFALPRNRGELLALELTRGEQMSLTTLISDYMRQHGSIDTFYDCSSTAAVAEKITPADLLNKIMEAKPKQ